MHAPTHAQSHIAQAVAATDSCFPLVMADTARVIWLCACVSYRLSRGLVYMCHWPLSLSYSTSDNLAIIYTVDQGDVVLIICWSVE